MLFVFPILNTERPTVPQLDYSGIAMCVQVLGSYYFTIPNVPAARLMVTKSCEGSSVLYVVLDSWSIPRASSFSLISMNARLPFPLANVGRTEGMRIHVHISYAKICTSNNKLISHAINIVERTTC